jgi:hypothetical protein
VSEISDTPIPLSHLGLDLPTPEFGWVAYLASRGIEVVEDGIGRSAVSSADAKMLISEHRESENLKARNRAAAERAAVESDRQRRAQLPSGVPADLILAGMRPAEALFAAELDSYGYRPRRMSVAEDLLSNDGSRSIPSVMRSESCGCSGSAHVTARQLMTLCRGACW